MKKIRGKGKMFVYSSFKENGGIKSFVRVLEEYGYKNYETDGEGRKRFAIWSGDEDMSYREEVKQVFNQKDNLDGSKLKILLLTDYFFILFSSLVLYFHNVKNKDFEMIFLFTIMKNYFFMQNRHDNLLILNDKIKVLYKT
jgi:hypothetical protein